MPNKKNKTKKDYQAQPCYALGVHRFRSSNILIVYGHIGMMN